MVIQHNIGAMNSDRQLGIVQGRLAKTARNLSSGYKINIAADDATGLSISEKMRRQIRGLTQGIENTEDGVSLCQVADGALAEVHDMLQRINELAVKAANGTNSASDRMAINDEVSSLLMEIDRIGDTTRFNELYLFRGNANRMDRVQSTLAHPTAVGKYFQLVGSNNTTTTGYMQEKLPVNVLAGYKTTQPVDPTDTEPYVGVHIDFKELVEDKGNIKELAGTGFYLNCCTDCCPTKVEFTDSADIIGTMDSIKIGVKKADGSYYTSANEFVNAIVDEMNKVNIAPHIVMACEANAGTTLYLYDIDNDPWTDSDKKLAYYCDQPTDGNMDIDFSAWNQGSGLWIQSGCDVGDGMVLHIGYVNTEVLRIDDLDVLTEDNSRKAMEKADAAIRMVSAQRSRIGAYQNRLEHTIANEQNVVENTTAAESQIRDTDIAKEMVAFSNDNILAQAGQSMLAQANQSRQGILSLLSA